MLKKEFEKTNEVASWVAPVAVVGGAFTGKLLYDKIKENQEKKKLQQQMPMPTQLYEVPMIPVEPNATNSQSAQYQNFNF